MSKIKILDINVDNITMAAARQKLEQFLTSKKGSLICTPNAEMVVAANSDPYLKEILNDRSDLNLPDSFGLLWAAKFNTLRTPSKGILRTFVVFLEWIFTIVLIPVIPWIFKKPIPEKISGSDFIWEISKFASDNKLKIFLLGGGPTVAERAALELQTKYPDIRIAGVYSGSSENSEEITRAVQKSRAEILLVAFGAPKQEKWLAENLQKTTCKVAIGLGGTFDFVSGLKKRAPRWMQASGLEWLFRLMQEPWRIKRQLSLPKFLWLVFKSKLNGQLQ